MAPGGNRGVPKGGLLYVSHETSPGMNPTRKWMGQGPIPTIGRTQMWPFFWTPHFPRALSTWMWVKKTTLVKHPKLHHFDTFKKFTRGQVWDICMMFVKAESGGKGMFASDSEPWMCLCLKLFINWRASPPIAMKYLKLAHPCK